MPNPIIPINNANNSKPPFVANPNTIPEAIAALIQSGQGGDAGALAQVPDTEKALPPPTVVQAAQASAPPVPDIPPNIQGAIGATQPPTPSADPFTDMVKPPQDAQPKLAPQPKLVPPHKSLGQKFMSALPYVGAAGAAMEAAGDPHGSGSGGKMLEQSLQARNAAAAKREELEKVHIPEAQAHARYYDSLNPTKIQAAQIGANAKENVAQIGADSRENIADTGADVKRELGRYKAVPGVGLFDTQTQRVIPGTAQGVILDADMAKSYDIPAKFIGTPVKLTDLAAKERADNGNLALTQGAKGPALVNKRQASGKDLGLGSPAIAARQSGVVDVNEDGVVKPMTDAQRLQAGAPRAQTLVSTGKATNAVYQPALDADMRLKQMYQQATDVSGASDQALLFNHIAMTGGAVKGLRMGEYLTEAHRQARGIPEDLSVMWNRLATGESLSPQQRQNFVRLAESVRQTTWDRARKQAPLIGAANEPAPDPDLPELNELRSNAPVPVNAASPKQQATQTVNRKTTPNSGGAPAAPAPEGTIVRVGNGQQIKRGGKWVPYTGQ